MIGLVDESNRALISLAVRKQAGSEETEVTAWIDTAFDGHLVFPRAKIIALGLSKLALSEAILADGSRVTLETYYCVVDWFGKLTPLQVIANDGAFPLLGTGLLENRVLKIDFAQRTVKLD